MSAAISDPLSASSASWAQRGRKAFLFTANRPEPTFVRGEGMYLWDESGRSFLDFVAGWAVCSLGHSPRAVREALTRQSQELVHSSPGYWNRPAIELAERLGSLSGLSKVFLGTTGAEANECAIKLARKHGERNLGGAFQIVCATNGFHGRTLATMSATGKPAWRGLFEPKVPGFVHVPYNDAEALERAVEAAPTCAVLFETVQGEGGAIPATTEFVQAARKLCDRRGALLMLDEVQAGMGRCGKLFAFQRHGILPDVLTLGKGLGSGFPVSACLTRPKFDLFEPGDQGGTYTFSPLGASVGNAVLTEIVNRDLPAHAEAMGALVREALERLSQRFGLSGLRGQGLLLAVDLPRPCAPEVAAAALDEGLLVNAPRPATLRFMPPLILERSHVEEMEEKLARTLGRALA